MCRIVPILLIWVLAPATVFGAGVQLLKDTPLSELNEADAASWNAFILQSLDGLEDGEAGIWRAQSSTIRGIVKPSFTYAYAEMTCRRLRLGLKGGRNPATVYQLEFCKTADVWKGATTPAALMQESDWVRLKHELQQVLDEGANGVPSSWFEPRTKNAGVIVPLTSEANGRTDCRNVAISLIASSGSTADGQYVFCRDGKGEWTRQFDAH